jgi:hypothetical protein
LPKSLSFFSHEPWLARDIMLRRIQAATGTLADSGPSERQQQTHWI